MLDNRLMGSKENDAGGLDLIIEKDAGNPVRILTGKKDCSRDMWKRLKILCEDSIGKLEE